MIIWTEQRLDQNQYSATHEAARQSKSNFFWSRSKDRRFPWLSVGSVGLCVCEYIVNDIDISHSRMLVFGVHAFYTFVFSFVFVGFLSIV